MILNRIESGQVLTHSLAAIPVTQSGPVGMPRERAGDVEEGSHHRRKGGSGGGYTERERQTDRRTDR